MGQVINKTKCVLSLISAGAVQTGLLTKAWPVQRVPEQAAKRSKSGLARLVLTCVKPSTE